MLPNALRFADRPAMPKKTGMDATRFGFVAHRDVDDPVRIAAPCPFARARSIYTSTSGAAMGRSRSWVERLNAPARWTLSMRTQTGLSREEIAIVSGYSDERSRIVQRRIEVFARQHFNIDDFEEASEAGESPLARAGDL